MTQAIGTTGKWLRNSPDSHQITQLTSLLTALVDTPVEPAAVPPPDAD